MAGFVPEERRDSGCDADAVPKRTARRQWTLHHAGTRGSLHQLRSSLAEGGCERSQLVLARQLLDADDADARIDAVYWLVRASSQGSEDATALLRQCAEAGRGVTEHNFIDVRNCLAMSVEEKRCRRAARLLFGCLCDGQEFITTEQIRRCLMRGRVQQDGGGNGGSQLLPVDANNDATPRNSCIDAEVVSSSDVDVKNEDRLERPCLLVNDAGHDPACDVKLSEECMLAVASSIVRGDLPSIHGHLNLDTSDRSHNASRLSRILTPHVRSARAGYDLLVEMFGDVQDSALFHWLIPTFLIKVLAVLTLIPLVNGSLVWSLLPTLIMYAALFIMLVSSLRAVRLHKQLTELRVWSRALRLVDDRLNTSTASARFSRNNLRPHLLVLTCALIAAISLSHVPSRWALSSEMAVMSALMCVALFVSLRQFCQPLCCLSLALHVTLAALHTLPSWWRPPVIASIPVTCGVFVEMSLPSMLHLAALLCYVLMARRSNGVTGLLLPHLGVIAWLQLCVVFGEAASGDRVARALGLFFSTLLALPLFGGVLLVVPAAAIAGLLYDLASVVQAVFVVALTVAPLIATRLQRQGGGGRVCCSVWLCAIIACVISTAFYLTYNMSSDIPPSQPSSVPSLSWSQFEEVCHGASLQKHAAATSAHAQLTCGRLRGVSVTWSDGVVSDVRVASVENSAFAALAWLPSRLASCIACLLDALQQPSLSHSATSAQVECDRRTLSDAQWQRCAVVRDTTSDQCSLSAWDRRLIEVSVLMPAAGLLNSSPSIILDVLDETLQSAVLNLVRGDSVTFSGRLWSHLGSTQPHVRLTALRCDQCAVESFSSPEQHADKHKPHNSQYILDELSSVLGVALNFICSPLLRYEPETSSDSMHDTNNLQ